MAVDLAKLVVKLECQTAQYQAELEKSKAKLSRFEKSVSDSTSKIAKSFAVVTTAAAVALGALTRNAINAADGVNDLVKQTGISAESLSQLSYAAKLSGTDIDGVITGFRKLTASAFDAANGVKAPADAFKRLGISVTEADGSLKGTESLFLDVADSFSKLTDGAAKAAMAQDVFGKSGAQLIPMLNQGRAGVEALKKEADRLGLTISGNTAAAADEFNDNIERVKQTGIALGNQIATQLLPTFNGLAEAFSGTANAGQQVASVADAVVAGFRVMLDGAIRTGAFFEGLGKSVGALGASLVALAEGDFRRAWSIIEERNADGLAESERNAKLLAAVWGKSGAAVVQAAQAADVELKETLLFGGGGSRVQEFQITAKKIESTPTQKFFDDLNALTKTSSESAVSAYHEQKEALEQLYSSGIINATKYNERISEAVDALLPEFEVTAKRMKEVVEKQTNELNEFQKQAAQSSQTIIADALISGFEGGTKGILKSFGDMIIQLTAQAVAADLAGKIFGSAGGGTGSGWVGAAMSLFGMGSGRAMGGPVAAGTAYKINENTPNSEWFVPSQNGKVVPANQMGGGGITNNFHIDAPRGSVSMETQTQIANRMAGALATARRRNG